MSQSVQEIDNVIHPVENQWHYHIMMVYGYVPLTKQGIGLVRSYAYEHPTTKHQIIITTGSSSDYWADKTNNTQGYWAELTNHLASIS